MAKSSGEGFDNPFFRDHEAIFDGGEKTIDSPVDSVFSGGYVRKDMSNVMEDEIASQLRPHKADRQAAHKGGKK